MEIKTKFNLGDKVWTIYNCMTTEIEVAALTIDVDGVWIRSKADYSAFHEDNCFPTKEALINHVLDNEN